MNEFLQRAADDGKHGLKLVEDSDRLQSIWKGANEAEESLDHLLIFPSCGVVVLSGKA